MANNRIDENNQIYSQAVKLMEEKTIPSYNEAVSLFSQIPGWKDTDVLATRCYERITILRRQKRSKILRIVGIAGMGVILTAFLLLLFLSIIPGVRYNNAVDMMSEGQYEEAIAIFSRLGNFGDSKVKEKDCYQKIAESKAAETAESPEQTHHETADEVIMQEVVLPGDSSTHDGDDLGGDEEKSGDEGAHAVEDSGPKEDDGIESDNKAVDTDNAGDESEGPDISKKDASEQELTSENENADADMDAESETEPEEEDTDSIKLLIILAGAIALALIVLLILFIIRKAIPAHKYKKAAALMKSGDYYGAIDIFREIIDYTDSRKKIDECESSLMEIRYLNALELKNHKQYDAAIEAFSVLNNYKDSQAQISECKIAILDEEYDAAMQLKDEGRFEEAAEAFEKLGGHRDSQLQKISCRVAIEKEPLYQDALRLHEEKKYKEALSAYNALRGYRDSTKKINSIMDVFYEAAMELKLAGRFNDAIQAFTNLNGYKDSNIQIENCRDGIKEIRYKKATELKHIGHYEDARDIFRGLKNYKDSMKQADDCRKAIRAPRPFDHIYRNQPAEEVVAFYGKPHRTRTEGNNTELIFDGITFMGATGILIISMFSGMAKSAVWQADFLWEPYERENAGMFAGIEYSRYKDYYVSLFGKSTSEYVRDTHKGAWWRRPELTLDVSGSDYVSIHCNL